MSYGTKIPKGAPLRRVVKCLLLGGGSILQPGFKMHWWQLELECGHTVDRRIKWKPVPNPRRGWAAQWRGPSLDRLPDNEPRRARCEYCARESRT